MFKADKNQKSEIDFKGKTQSISKAKNAVERKSKRLGLQKGSGTRVDIKIAKYKTNLFFLILFF